MPSENKKIGMALSDKKNGHAAVAVVDKKNYRPTDKEPFMNERQREYFREKLTAWKEDILKEAKETLAHLQAENENRPDLAQRPTARSSCGRGIASAS